MKVRCCDCIYCEIYNDLTYSAHLKDIRCVNDKCGWNTRYTDGRFIYKVIECEFYEEKVVSAHFMDI